MTESMKKYFYNCYKNAYKSKKIRIIQKCMTKQKININTWIYKNRKELLEIFFFKNIKELLEIFFFKNRKELLEIFFFTKQKRTFGNKKFRKLIRIHISHGAIKIGNVT